MIQLMLALRYYATGSFLITTGDFCGISETSAQKIVYRVSSAIASLRVASVWTRIDWTQATHNA